MSVSVLKKQQKDLATEVAEFLKQFEAGDTSVLSDLEAKNSELEQVTNQINIAANAAALLAKADDKPTTKSAEIGFGNSIGEHFAKHCGEAFVKGFPSGGALMAPEWKAATDIHLTGGTGSSNPLAPYLTTFDRTIVGAYRRPLITDLFGQGSISGQAITYLVEAAREGAPATTAEAGTKSQVHYPNPTSVTDAISKITAWFDMSEEMQSDLEFLVSEINNRLVYDLQLAEETQILSGDGTAPNLRGLLNRSGLQTETAADWADNPDAILRALTKVQLANGFAADAIVINPLDYQDLRLRKDSNGQYYGGGFFGTAYGSSGAGLEPALWETRTVLSPAIAQGTVVVGAFKTAATLYRKGGIQVAATNSHADRFVKDVITVRGEQRLALAVRRPSAFVVTTLAAPATPSA
jgi:HK97 family phage major capsid protein